MIKNFEVLLYLY